jgi:hypothetical protein
LNQNFGFTTAFLKFKRHKGRRREEPKLCHLKLVDRRDPPEYNLVIVFGGYIMPVGYELIYITAAEAPFWAYKLGVSPVTNLPSGKIPKGAKLHLQRPVDTTTTLGTHQSAYLDGVGQVIVQVSDLEAVTRTP